MIDGIAIDGQTIDTIVMPNGEEISVGGVTPTGNINITQAGVTDVTNYATATVPSGSATGPTTDYDSSSGGLSNNKGILQVASYGVPTTPSVSAGYVSSAPATSRTVYQSTGIPYNPTITVSGDTVTIPRGFYTPQQTKTVASGTLGAASYSRYKDSTNFNIAISFPNATAGYYSSITGAVATEFLENVTVTPSESVQVITPTSDRYYLDSVTVNAISSDYVGSGITRRSSSDLTASGATISVPSGFYENNASKAVSSGTEGTPTATKGTVTNHSVSITPSVTNSVGYISGGTHNGTAVSVSASELVSGTYTVSSSGTKDVTNYASISVASGGATASATKGTVSNHSITVTPSVTRTAGYITAGSANGTAVTVSASELVSGSQTLSDNGTYDVTNLAEVVVDVQGGGGGGTQIATKTATPSTASSSIQFTSLSGNPTSFVVTSQVDIATNTNGVTAVVFDGSSLHGQTMTTQVTADTGFTKSYSNGTLTITATSANFEANAYKLVYTYGGSTSDIETADVQVGSGATSITFSVNGRPAYWSCIFKSDFSTSSGYQRVIAVANDGSSTYGLAMDSSAHVATSWTASYSGGNLVITSQGTNNGGYFHQPGNYQLTYYVDSSAPSYQSKTVSPSTSSQTVYPDSGYDALESVTVNAMPSMTLPSSASATSSGTSKATITPTSSVQYLNIPTGYNATAQYYTIGASGGGGGDKNIQISQSTTRNNASSLTKANGDLTVSKTGTYDIYWTASRSNTSTSYTWGSQLYVDGTGYGTENTSWSNNVQNNHLSNVSLTANQKLSVYTRGRSGNYYTYAPMLIIVET